MHADNPLSSRWLTAILLCGSLAFGTMLAFAWRTLGTNDVLTWEGNLRVLRSDGPVHLYEERVRVVEDNGHQLGAEIFNHPPLMISALRFWGWLSDVTGIRFRVWLRVTSSLASIVTLLLICLGVRRGCWPGSGPALVALALCPVSIFVAGFHGNTDPVMICFLVAAAYAMDCRGSILLCALLMGLAVEVKVIPLILIPSFLLYLKSWRNRAIALGGFTLTALPPVLPYVRALPIMIPNILGYSSISGHWGFTWFVQNFHPERSAIGLKYLMYVILIVASVWMNWRQRRISLFVQWGFLLSLVLFFIPGFGIQYLIWMAPWIVALGTTATLTYYVAGGAFAFVVYTWWCRGLPWYFANAFAGYWYGKMEILQNCAWLSVLFVLYLYWRSFRTDSLNNGSMSGLSRHRVIF